MKPMTSLLEKAIDQLRRCSAEDQADFSADVPRVVHAAAFADVAPG
jgi:hypothetical protein